MQIIILLATVLSACSQVDAAQKHPESFLQTHPIQGILDLLAGLKTTSLAEGKTEKAAHSKFRYWCKSTLDAVGEALSDGTEKLESLGNEIAGLNKNIQTLTDQIGATAADIVQKDLAKAAAITQYNVVHAAAVQDITDLTNSVKCVDGVLSDMMGSQAASKKTSFGMLLNQQHVKNSLALISLGATDEALLNDLSDDQDDDDDDDDDDDQVLRASAGATTTTTTPLLLAKGDRAKHVAGYKSKSDSVIQLLRNLLAEFTDGKQKAVMSKTRMEGSHSMQDASRLAAITAATTQKNLAEADKTEKTTKRDRKVQEQTDYQTAKAIDEATKTDTLRECSLEQIEFDKRSKTREAEIAAMDVATKILTKVTGVQTQKPNTVALPPKPATVATDAAAGEYKEPAGFLQIGSIVSDPRRLNALSFVRQAAAVSNEKALQRLAVAIAAHLNGPMDKMMTMIQNMIWRLEKEQKSETEHKLWCDKEVQKAGDLMLEHTDTRDTLAGKITIQTNLITSLESDITTAESKLASYAAFEKEATEIRNIGKKENAVALKDARTAQEAVKSAMAAITAFYVKSGKVADASVVTGTGLVQEGEDEDRGSATTAPPATVAVVRETKPAGHGAAYSGVGDPNAQPGGILTLMQQVQTDFETMEANIKSAELTDAGTFKKDMADLDIEQARQKTVIKTKTNDKQRQIDKKARYTKEWKTSKIELTEATKYMADLQPACVSGDSDYVTRKGNRLKEINALKTAKTTLADAFKPTPAPATNATNGTFLQEAASEATIKAHFLA